MHRVCSLTVLLCLVVATALAQDSAKIAPKNVKVEIDNPEVRVLRVHYDPHDKIPMHEHPDVVIVYLTDAHAKQTFPDGKTKEGQAKAGDVIFRPSVKHAAESLSDKPIELIEIELKCKTTASEAATTKPASGQ